jgi:hypothetical protein
VPLRENTLPTPPRSLVQIRPIERTLVGQGGTRLALRRRVGGQTAQSELRDWSLILVFWNRMHDALGLDHVSESGYAATMKEADATGMHCSKLREVWPVGFETENAQFAQGMLLLVSGYHTVRV